MSIAVQNPDFLPHSFHEFGGKTEDKPSMGARIKGFFLGRIFTNWKDSFLVAGVVFWVTKAAVSFFTGYWMMSLVELFTGGFLAMMRKDYRDFTNLHKATGAIHGEAAKLTVSNHVLKQNIGEFKKEVGHLADEREKIGKENQKFASSNARYQTHLTTMERTLDRAVGEIDAASRRGENVSREVLHEALDSFASQKATLETMERELLDKKDETLARWQQIVSQVGNMSAHGVDVLNEANERLQATLQDIRAAEATKATLEDQITRLKAQVDIIEEATGYNLDTAKKANRAMSLTNVFFKGICSSENSRTSEQANAMLLSLLVVGAIAFRTIPSLTG